MNTCIRFFLLAFLLLAIPIPSMADKPVAMDSRIKVFVYNEYEVFRLTFHYRHHAHIDFARGEVVRSISMGDNSNWYIEPIGSSLFIQPHEKGLYTNMTIITNKRTYEFDLISKDPDEFGGGVDKDLVYVVKFFYPDNDSSGGFDEMEKSRISRNDTESIGDRSRGGKYRSSSHTPNYNDLSDDDNGLEELINNRYSLIGNRDIAPLEIFDDGSYTYMKFANRRSVPRIYGSDEDNREFALRPSNYKGYLVVDAVLGKFILRKGDKVVELFNDG